MSDNVKAKHMHISIMLGGVVVIDVYDTSVASARNALQIARQKGCGLS